MIGKENAYNMNIPELSRMQEISEEEIVKRLDEYLNEYEGSFNRSQQIRYFKTFVKGLLSNLDRKTIEPIALSFLGEKDVRGMQQFFTRSKGWEEALKEKYKETLSEQLSDTQGFLSVDESDFVKKGKESAGVARQYCGRLGKTENCQAGVFVSYASQRGIGLVDSQLYIPKFWFEDEHKERRVDCHIPEELTFQTKNEMAKKMIKSILDKQLFDIQCIGCDASFGSDHTFIDSLPKQVRYFASVRENEHIFINQPKVSIPQNSVGRGNKFKHPRSEESPVTVKTIVDDETIPWVRRIISQGSKGNIVADIKCLRIVSCRTENRFFMPKSEVWLYIRKHEDGTIKYFISDMPEDTSHAELDRLATARWSIEQTFQECKSYLGMTHYEHRSYHAWHRHMLLVMVAHLFITTLRFFFKRLC